MEHVLSKIEEFINSTGTSAVNKQRGLILKPQDMPTIERLLRLLNEQVDTDVEMGDVQAMQVDAVQGVQAMQVGAVQGVRIGIVAMSETDVAVQVKFDEYCFNISKDEKHRCCVVSCPGHPEKKFVNKAIIIPY